MLDKISQLNDQQMNKQQNKQMDNRFVRELNRAIDASTEQAPEPPAQPKRPKWGRTVAILAAVAAGLFGLVQWYRYQPPSPTTRDNGNNSSSDSDEETPLIDQFLPKAEFAGEISVNVHAPAAAIFAAFRTITLADMPLANWLGNLRYLPAKDAAQTTPPDQSFMQVMQETGLVMLANVSDRELIIGAIGRFHNLADQQMVTLPHPHAFVRFNDPTYQKLIMSIRLEPLSAHAQTDDPDGYRLVLTHRTHALGSEARRKFALYWIGIKPGGNFVSWLLLRAVKRRAEATIVPQRDAPSDNA